MLDLVKQACDFMQQVEQYTIYKNMNDNVEIEVQLYASGFVVKNVRVFFYLTRISHQFR